MKEKTARLRDAVLLGLLMSGAIEVPYGMLYAIWVEFMLGIKIMLTGIIVFCVIAVIGAIINEVENYEGL